MSVSVWLGAFGHLASDEELRICGSVPEMGNWNLEEAPCMQQVDGEEGLMVFQAELHQHARIEFKLALCGYMHNFESMDRSISWFGAGMDMKGNLVLHVVPNGSRLLSPGPLPFCLKILDGSKPQDMGSFWSRSTEVTEEGSDASFIRTSSSEEECASSGSPRSQREHVSDVRSEQSVIHSSRPRAHTVPKMQIEKVTISSSPLLEAQAEPMPEPQSNDSAEVPRMQKHRRITWPLEAKCRIYAAESDLDLCLPELRRPQMRRDETAWQEARATWCREQQQHASLCLQSQTVSREFAVVSCTRHVLRMVYSLAADRLDDRVAHSKAVDPEPRLDRMHLACLKLRERIAQSLEDEKNLEELRVEHHGQGRTSSELKLLQAMPLVRDVIEQRRELMRMGNSQLLHMEYSKLRQHAENRQFEGALLHNPVPQSSKVPVFIMMPLDWASDDGRGLRNQSKLKHQLSSMKACGVQGVMADVWWGTCEPEPGQYRFGCVQALCALLHEMKMELQVVMSFHSCGGNVGDSVTIPLPRWALHVAREKELLYCNRYGQTSDDCLSLSADTTAAFPGPDGARTALACYGDFIASCARSCKDHLGKVVVEIQVGMGPCGELRYPSYLLSKGWMYPGVGLVTAHDPGMRQRLEAETGMTEPPDCLPDEANSTPDDVPLFQMAWRQVRIDKPLFRTGDGKSFLEWYSKVLLEHGESLLRQAISSICQANQGTVPDGLGFSIKVAGIHWQMQHPSRAAEMCAGYNCCTSAKADAYMDIAEMIARVAEDTSSRIFFNFTCLEMSSAQNHAMSDPEALVSQVRRACLANNVPLCGENALCFDLANDTHQFDQMHKMTRSWSRGPDRMQKITLLRMDETHTYELRALREFTRRLKDA
eukprot:TRINITY_DN78283_c0_g1_i1.p1 TRINITY_DN78283_c0_g1~~TRINITY_DN78283_c0_g1_i1.p1  ORF type:complete len:880 (+),score=138.99 TRINITY_DN78283_c0_g1_i1:56-2695(+)